MKENLIPILTIAATLLAGGRIHGALIASADFEGNSTGGLNGQAGGAGWTTNWTADTINSTVTIVGGGGLNYSNGAVFSNGGSQFVNVIAGTALQNSVLLRNFASQTGSVYMSFLFRDSVNDTLTTGNDFAQVGFGPATTDGNPRISMVRDADALNLRTGTSGLAASGTASSVGTTFMIVLKAIPAGGGTNYDAQMWVNPSSLTEGVPNASAAGAGITDVGTFLSRVARHEVGDAYQIDNIRIGTTWGDVVTGVPEPSTIGLLGLSGLALLRRRR